jgi:uncharacterized protein (TIGR02246 family)
MLRCVLLLCCASLAMPAQTTEVEQVLKASEAAWNRGDLAAFASYYDDSPETTFIGREVVRGGVAAILARYQRVYPRREAGTLEFSEIAVRALADGVSLTTGKFTLRRSAAGGGDASGRFTLILERKAGKWKIIRDHTSYRCAPAHGVLIRSS